MASIFARLNKDGSTTWRVMIRRKGIKPFITGFSSYEDAFNFCKKNEPKYVLNPEKFSYDYLKSIRNRKFSRDYGEKINER